ncbi:hypothetical protein ES702_01862 [subsurface metagenome]
MNYVVLICARNEEKYIGSCLASVYFQSIPPKLVVVVDDGSSDDTAKRANQFERHLTIRVIRKPDRGFTAINTPLMADTYNVGLERFDEVEYDFLLILGADTAIPPEYVKTLYRKILPSQGVVSGRYPGVRKGYAAATGRFIRRRILDHLGGRFPKNNSWESAANHCSRFMGYENRSFDVPIYNLRPPGKRKRSYTGPGRAVKEMGYYWPNVLYKGFIMTKKKGIIAALQMFYGYFTHKPQDHLPDWAQWINKLQKEGFRKKVKGWMKCS